MAPHYKSLLETCLKNCFELKNLIAESKYFKLADEEVDMAIMLFTAKEKIPPMSYLDQRYCAFSNVSNKRLSLVTTEINEEKLFRVVCMDPNLNPAAFVKQLEEEYEMYSADYNESVKARLEAIRSIVEVCDTEEELSALVHSGKKLVACSCIEPSGHIHIAQAVITLLNVHVLGKNGCYVRLYITDWLAQLNHRLKGNLEKIKNAGRYFIEVLRALKIDESVVEFILTSDIITKSPTYWSRMLEIATQITLEEAKICIQRTGKREDTRISASQVIYPCMQIADIFELGADIVQLGADQRDSSRLAQKYAKRINVKAPTIISHHVLANLKTPLITPQLNATSLSSSSSTSPSLLSPSFVDFECGIYMEDREEDVRRKFENYVCSNIVENNTIFEYIKYITIPWFKEFTVDNQTFRDAESLRNAWPTLIKNNVKKVLIEQINAIINPVREHFAHGEMRKLFERVVASY
jgi:tyrosyl-tRNA synthetase